MNSRAALEDNNCRVGDLVTVFLISLLIIAGRFGYLFYITDGNIAKVIFPDEAVSYIASAQEIQKQGLSYFLTQRSLWSGPVNPLWIAAWGINLPVIRIINVLLMSVCGLLVWLLTHRLFGRASAYVALLLLSLHPLFFVFTPTVLTEPLFTFLLFLSFFLVAINESGNRSIDLAAGLIAGICTLTRPTLQFFPFFILAFVIFLKILPKRFSPLKLKESLASIGGLRFVYYLVGFLIIVAPFLMKNILYLQKAGIANGSGAVLYLGNDLRKNGDEPIYSEMDYDTGNITAPYTHLDTEGDRRLTIAAKSFIKKHPLDAFILTLRKPFKYLFGYPKYYFFPQDNLISAYHGHRKSQIADSLWELCIVVFVTIGGIVGIVFLPMPPAIRLFSFLLILNFIALHTPTCPFPRLATPMFPVLCVFAAGISCCRGFCSQRIWSAISALCVCLWICFIGLIWFPNLVSARSFSWFETIRTIDKTAIKELHDVRPMTDQGNMAYESTGGNPFLVIPITPLQIQKNQVFFIELTANPPSSTTVENPMAQIFWAESPEAGFTQARSRVFPILMDGKAHLYRISPTLSPSWTGTLGVVRLDFSGQQPGARYRVSTFTISQ